MGKNRPVAFTRRQNASQTPFDNTDNGFTANNVQDAIEELQEGILLINVPRESAVAVGDAVYMDSGTAKQARADVFSTSNVIGLVEGISSGPDLCNVRVSGKTTAIYTGLDTTKDYFLSTTTAGGLQTTAPTGSGEVILRVAQPFDTEVLVIVKDVRTVRA